MHTPAATVAASSSAVAVVAIVAPSSSRCAAVHRRCTVMPLPHRCHWAPSSHRLRISGPAAIAIRHCRALYPSRRTPLPSCCVRLCHRAIVHCRRRRARCACFAWLASILWRSAWAVGLSMGWWRGRCWGPLRVACMAVVVAAVGSSSRATDIVCLCATPGRCSLVEGG